MQEKKKRGRKPLHGDTPALKVTICIPPDTYAAIPEPKRRTIADDIIRLYSTPSE